MHAPELDEAHEPSPQLDQAVRVLDEVSRIDQENAHARVTMREHEARDGIGEVELVVERGLEAVGEEGEAAFRAVRHVDDGGLHLRRRRQDAADSFRILLGHQSSPWRRRTLRARVAARPM